jgi:hypothetical protein
MQKLNDQFKLPLKVLTARMNHMKNNLKGLIQAIEKRAIKNSSNKDSMFLTWDDWIHAALDCDFENHQKDNINKTIDSLLIGENPKASLYKSTAKTLANNLQFKSKKPSWTDNLKEGEHIPHELLDRLPVTTGELVTVGNWMLTKNIYRFDTTVINELLKVGFEGEIPNHIVNLPDLSVYVQTDNADLYFEKYKVVGVIFCITTLTDQKLLVSTFYLDTGIPRTIAITLNEDQDINQSLSDFIDEFQQDYDPETMSDQVDIRLDIQKKLINLVLWFSQDEPEVTPLTPEPKQSTPFTIIKNEKRLFEASKYRPCLVGKKTGEQISKFYSDVEREHAQYSGGKRPHIRKPHWHLYWYGKKGQYESYDFKFIPAILVGGSKKTA